MAESVKSYLERVERASTCKPLCLFYGAVAGFLKEKGLGSGVADEIAFALPITLVSGAHFLGGLYLRSKGGKQDITVRLGKELGDGSINKGEYLENMKTLDHLSSKTSLAKRVGKSAAKSLGWTSLGYGIGYAGGRLLDYLL